MSRIAAFIVVSTLIVAPSLVRGQVSCIADSKTPAAAFGPTQSPRCQRQDYEDACQRPESYRYHKGKNMITGKCEIDKAGSVYLILEATSPE